MEYLRGGTLRSLLKEKKSKDKMITELESKIIIK